MPDAAPLHDLHCFILENVGREPAPRRIRLLRTLADVVGSSADAKQLRAMADDLAAVEEQHLALMHYFQSKQFAALANPKQL